MGPQIKCIVRTAASDDYRYAAEIMDEMAGSAARRGTGIDVRPPEYALEKMENDLAVIAVNSQNNEWAGFCYIETWKHERYAANSGLIVSPKYRGMGISKEIKIKLFEHCRMKFPFAKLFSLTASPAVIHINKALGYKTVSYSDLLNDELFLTGCNSWVDYIDLMSNKRPGLDYQAMVFEPEASSAFASMVPSSFSEFKLADAV